MSQIDQNDHRPEGCNNGEPSDLAPDGQVEVTSEMLEVGVQMLWASGIVDGQVDADKLVLAEIFQAMRALDPGYQA